MLIYKITNNKNGKIYIGQTSKSLIERFSNHCKKTSKSTISLAIQKYGKENFTIEQIETATTQKQLDKKEIYWIKYFDSISPKGYNLTTGGEHYTHSKQSIEKNRKWHIGKKHSEETKLKMKLSHKLSNNPLHAKGENNLRSKVYIITDIHGNKMQVKGLRKFAQSIGTQPQVLRFAKKHRNGNYKDILIHLLT